MRESVEKGVECQRKLIFFARKNYIKSSCRVSRVELSFDLNLCNEFFLEFSTSCCTYFVDDSNSSDESDHYYFSFNLIPSST